MDVPGEGVPARARPRRAQGLVEYALIVGIVSLAALVALTALGGGLGADIGAAIAAVASSVSAP